MSSPGTPTQTTNGSTSTSTSSSSSINPNPGFNPTQSSTLYLFTFLATLLLLLAVSCAIVVRSFILRRRFRRRIEEAIAAGVLIPGALDDPSLGGTGRSRRRDFGEKPKLWEVWMDDLGHSDRIGGHSKRDSLGKSEGKWENIVPISAMMLPTGSTAANASAGESDMSMPFVGQNHANFSNFFFRLFGSYPVSTRTATPARNHSASEDDDTSSASKEQTPDDDGRLQVAVLISMPNANSPSWGNHDSPKGKARGLSTSEETGEIPDVVFGVTSVGYQM